MNTKSVAGSVPCVSQPRLACGVVAALMSHGTFRTKSITDTAKGHGPGTAGKVCEETSRQE
eukprot:5466686-Amphidinium_carterae.1